MRPSAATTASKVGAATYQDFEPFCHWLREEGQITLVVHVPPEFKREHLKVFISPDCATLRITGDRPVDDETKRSRFHKEIKIPRECSADKISAQLAVSGHHLHIVMPKKISTTISKQQQDKKLAMTMNIVAMGAAAAVVLAFGAYAAFKFRSPSSVVGASDSQKKK